MFFAVVLLLNAINYAFGLNLENYLSLNPQRILNNFEVWRLFSFSFIISNPTFIFLLAPIFIFASPILEEYLNKYLYPIFLFLVSSLQSFVLTLVFWNKNISLSGIEGISFFILTLLVFLKPRVRVFPKHPVTVASFGLVMITLWVLSIYLPWSEQANNAELHNAASAIFGVLIGISVYIPIRYMDKYLKNRPIENKEKKIVIPKPEELSMAAISAQNLSKLYHQFDEEYCSITDDFQTNEETLNEILDKINLSGKESLSYYEMKFLEEYSKRL